jgi:RNA polymerase sigma-70 factor (ECF subfamily)
MQGDGWMPLSDEELYRRMTKGDRTAFAELYDRRGPPLHRYVMHISGSHSAAEEVTHDVFLRLIRGKSDFDERRGTLEAYLYGMARNLVRVMRRHPSAGPAGETAAEHNILEDLIRHERTAALYVALRELPEAYRDAVILCDLEERSYEDVARIMARPVGTIRSRLHRARQLLAARLKPLSTCSGVAGR